MRAKNASKIYTRGVLEDDPHRSFGIVADGARRSYLLDPDRDPKEMDDVENPDGPPEFNYGSDPEGYGIHYEDRDDAEEYRGAPFTDDAYPDDGYLSENADDDDSGATNQWEGLDVGRQRTPYQRGSKTEFDWNTEDDTLDEAFDESSLDSYSVDELTSKTSDLEGERLNIDGEWEWQADPRRRGQIKGRDAAFNASPYDSEHYGDEEMPINIRKENGNPNWQMMQVGHIQKDDQRERAVNFYKPDEGTGTKLNSGTSYSASGVGVREYPQNDVMYDSNSRQRSIHNDAHTADYEQIQIDEHSSIHETD